MAELITSPTVDTLRVVHVGWSSERSCQIEQLAVASAFDLVAVVSSHPQAAAHCRRLGVRCLPLDDHSWPAGDILWCSLSGGPTSGLDRRVQAERTAYECRQAIARIQDWCAGLRDADRHLIVCDVDWMTLRDPSSGLADWLHLTSHPTVLTTSLRGEASFRQLQQLLIDQRLGRCFRWTNAIRVARPLDTTPEAIESRLWEHLSDLCDQLLQLTGKPPTTCTTWPRYEPLPDAGAGARSLVGLFSILSHPSGWRAELDIDLLHPAEGRTGWTVDGTLGSYRGGRLYRQLPDGEIADELLPSPPESWQPLLSEIEQCFRCGSSRLLQPRQALDAAALLQRLMDSVPTR